MHVSDRAWLEREIPTVVKLSDLLIGTYNVPNTNK